MKRRGWRVALTAAASGMAVIAGLVVFNWPTVRDHAEAWWFQATRKTAERSPGDDPANASALTWMFQCLADERQRVVIYDPEAVDGPTGLRREEQRGTLTLLRQDGFRILEQRLPRRAYVVVEYPGTIYFETLLPPGTIYFETLLPPGLITDQSTTFDPKASPR